MPEMDGLEATRRLRSNPDTSDLTIIGLSANAMESDHTEGLGAGMDAFLTKPIEVEKLNRTLAHYSITRGLGQPAEKS